MHCLACKILVIYSACTFAELPAQSPSASAMSQERIHWAGYVLSEVRTLRELPPGIQAVLGVGTSGLNGIADRNGKYNPTDVVDSSLPMRRFLVAGVDANITLVAIEHGGRGWRVEVTLFKNTTVERSWTLSNSPKALRELVNHLSLKPVRP